MQVLRFTNKDDSIGLGSKNAIFLGGGGDDVYILDPRLVPADARITISGSGGGDVFRLTDGLEIEESRVATLRA